MEVYHILHMLQSDIIESLEILYDSFTNDPYSWSKAVGFSFDMLRSWLKDYLINRVICPYIPSIVVKNDEGVLGVCTMEDFNNPPFHNNPNNNDINEICNACTNLFWKYIEKFNSNISKNEKGLIAYISFIAVDKEHRRKNIGDMLLKESSDILRKNGYKYAVAFCTSYRSRSLFEKNGYNYIGGINYKTLCINGRNPFSSLEGECSVMFISL